MNVHCIQLPKSRPDWLRLVYFASMAAVLTLTVRDIFLKGSTSHGEHYEGWFDAMYYSAMLVLAVASFLMRRWDSVLSALGWVIVVAALLAAGIQPPVY